VYFNFFLLPVEVLKRFVNVVVVQLLQNNLDVHVSISVLTLIYLE
jgi:hypothetical protein